MSQVLKPKKGYKKVKWLFGKEIEIPGEWENKTLEFVGTLQGGFAFKSEDYVNYGIGLLKIANVSHGQIIWNEKSYVPKEYWNKYSDFQIQKGDVVIAMTRPLISGGMKIAFFSIKEKILLNQRVGRFIIKNIDKKFFYSLLNKKSFIDQIKTKLSESGQPNISSDEIEKIKIYFPKNISEQQKIASILSNIDNLINFTQKVIDQNKSLKQGLMQKLFTKGIDHKKFKKIPWLFNKELEIPQEWEVKKLDLPTFEYLVSGTNARSDLNESSENRYIHYGDIHTKWNLELNCDSEKIPRIDKEKVSKLPLLKEGDLIIADASEDIEGSGSSILLKNVKNKKIVAGLHTIVLRSKDENISTDFLKYLTSINSVKIQITSYVTGSKVYGLSKKTCKEIKVPFPKLSEQQKIASILSNVDEKISMQTKYLKTQKKLKKSLMQKLLTGQVRVAV